MFSMKTNSTKLGFLEANIHSESEPVIKGILTSEQKIFFITDYLF